MIHFTKAAGLGALSLLLAGHAAAWGQSQGPGADAQQEEGRRVDGCLGQGCARPCRPVLAAGVPGHG